MSRRPETIAGGAVIEYGLTVKVLGTGWKYDRYPLHEVMSPERLKAWRQRTDYAWRCSLCPSKAGVNWATADLARKHAEQHAREHPGIEVRELR